MLSHSPVPTRDWGCAIEVITSPWPLITMRENGAVEEEGCVRDGGWMSEKSENGEGRGNRQEEEFGEKGKWHRLMGLHTVVDWHNRNSELD